MGCVVRRGTESEHPYHQRAERRTRNLNNFGNVAVQDLTLNPAVTLNPAAKSRWVFRALRKQSGSTARSWLPRTCFSIYQRINQIAAQEFHGSRDASASIQRRNALCAWASRTTGSRQTRCQA
ncbi:hypothetical protein GCM10028792_10630 [Salinisphaera aquimarina]